MPRMIFVNLPVTDLERSVRFYEALGLRKEPKFSNDQAAMMVLSDTISVMLLSHGFYSNFTSRPIAEPRTTSQMLLCISCDSPDEVDRITEAAGRTGGTVDPATQGQREGAPMYGRLFEDPDGHQWEPMWMDPDFAAKGAHQTEAA
ncbi:lactoylglutathione lyase [Sphingomonas ginkgonis]|uniref:Lactoylglutathione lyase n=1 Tax=Sphingomonas ginkgonis TaxID=2315330 RepID=A0A429V7C5_9SPHN|nr:VOC family protein [Sphingomonas ginkgonis]RST29886.1 lactoylglutathione lyase [Sphingomonas ginkgonis]